jgi:hypothetical protein
LRQTAQHSMKRQTRKVYSKNNGRARRRRKRALPLLLLHMQAASLQQASCRSGRTNAVRVRPVCVCHLLLACICNTSSYIRHERSCKAFHDPPCAAIAAPPPCAKSCTSECQMHAHSVRVQQARREGEGGSRHADCRRPSACLPGWPSDRIHHHHQAGVKKDS